MIRQKIKRTDKRVDAILRTFETLAHEQYFDYNKKINHSNLELNRVIAIRYSDGDDMRCTEEDIIFFIESYKKTLNQIKLDRENLFINNLVCLYSIQVVCRHANKRKFAEYYLDTYLRNDEIYIYLNYITNQDTQDVYEEQWILKAIYNVDAILAYNTIDPEIFLNEIQSAAIRTMTFVSTD